MNIGLLIKMKNNILKQILQERPLKFEITNDNKRIELQKLLYNLGYSWAKNDIDSVMERGKMKYIYTNPNTRLLGWGNEEESFNLSWGIKIKEWKKTQPQWVQDIWNIEPEEARKLMKEDMKNNRYFEH
jgi:hypothetical protein